MLDDIDKTGLPPIIKWPGGKEKELKHILPNVPTFSRYFEPFVGGGAVFMAVRCKQCFVNDLSSELVALYNFIAERNEQFFRYLRDMNRSWIKSGDFFSRSSCLVELYIQFRTGQITSEELKSHIRSFCENNKMGILNIIGKEFSSLPCVIIKEMEVNLIRKMTRMHRLEQEKYFLPKGDVYDNIETAIKSAVYMNYRHLYNEKAMQVNKPLHTALFFFMRNYAYSGMFRYSRKGDFNVPYGGIAYNSKLLGKKIDYYQSNPLLEHFSDTKIYNLDFEDFLRQTNPTQDDFVFLDPPYDTEFSTYANNAFTRADQVRLADYMLNECNAKWMLIIKYTDFIYRLYNKKGINIKTFDKEYVVSFMNRNNRKATHLMITNY